MCELASHRVLAKENEMSLRFIRDIKINPLRANDALRHSPGGGGANDALRHHFTFFFK